MTTLDQLFDKGRGPFWQSRSDDELLALQLTTDDPESLDDLSDDLPPDEDAVVEMGYNVAGRERGKVRCAFCQYPNHFNGVVMRYASGGRRLIGRDCAHTHYGVVFELLIKDFDAARDRRDYAERKRLTLAKEVDLLGLLRAMRGHPSIATFSSVKADLEEVLGERVWKKVQRVAATDGVAKFEEQISGESAREFFGKSAAFVIGREHALRGIDFLREGPSVGKRLAEIEADLAEVIETLRTPDASTAATRASLIRMGNILRAVEVERTRMRALASFFDPDNLGLVVEWAWNVNHRALAYEIHGRRLIAYEGDTDLCSVFLPDAYTLPGGALISAMQHALAKAPARRPPAPRRRRIVRRYG